MPVMLGEGEPAAGPWRVEPLSELVRAVTSMTPLPVGRPRIVAVDGRSAGGKTTLAERLSATLTGAQVVHTDDIAWAHSRFGWDDLMIDGVLDPLRNGRSVHYQPPGWTLAITGPGISRSRSMRRYSSSRASVLLAGA